jgi:hypothetical protein
MAPIAKTRTNAIRILPIVELRFLTHLFEFLMVPPIPGSIPYREIGLPDIAIRPVICPLT